MTQLAKQRLKFQHKICFRAGNEHLKLKSDPAISVASRMFRDGNFLRIYKKSQKAFLDILLEVVKTLPQNNEFKNLYEQYFSFRDFGRILFWKLTSVNSLFNLKQLNGRRILYYLKPERRHVLVLLWLKNLMRVRKLNNKNCTTRLFLPLLNFLYSNKNNNEVFSLKLRIYKMRMARG